MKADSKIGTFFTSGVTICSTFSGPVVGQRPDHHASTASPMISAAVSAAGPPLMASPYTQSYLQYGQVIQAMPPHYHGQVQHHNVGLL